MAWFLLSSRTPWCFSEDRLRARPYLRIGGVVEWPDPRATLPGPFGYVIDQLTLLAEKTGLSLLVSPNTPFKRCLKLMETGQADIMYGLVDCADRQKFMYLIPFRAAHPKVFVLLKNSPRDIALFDDLAGRVVAVARGFNFSPSSINLKAFSIGLTWLHLSRA